MKRLSHILLSLFICYSAIAQTSYEFENLGSETNANANYQLKDSLYNKNKEYTVKRSIDEVLKDKYTGKQYEYKDDLKEEKEEVQQVHSSSSGIALGKGFSFFMSVIFPTLLVVVVVLIVLKYLMNINLISWKRIPKIKATVSKKENVEENFDESDFEALLKEAIKNQNYRLAIRYYYLTLLKKLNHKKLIEYHKDKTNSDYLFEIEDQKIRSEFSYLSYVYTYIWYGEFQINREKFQSIQVKYQSFLKR